jgi:hypothetical protein
MVNFTNTLKLSTHNGMNPHNFNFKNKKLTLNIKFFLKKICKGRTKLNIFYSDVMTKVQERVW